MAIVQGSISVDVVSHDTNDYAYASVTNISRCYSPASSTTYGTIYLTTGSGAVTYVYLLFGDLSSIPENATITSVTCDVKCRINQSNVNRVASRQVQMFSGTQAKGEDTTVPQNVTAPFSLTVGSWTRDELQDARVRIYAARGTQNTTTSYYFYFYGATLTVSYEYDDTPPVTMPARVKQNGSWVTPSKLMVKQSGSWTEATKILVKDGGGWK